MGHKFQRVYDKDSLWTQRKISIRIIITTLMLSSLITLIVYVFDQILISDAGIKSIIGGLMNEQL